MSNLVMEFACARCKGELSATVGATSGCDCDLQVSVDPCPVCTREAFALVERMRAALGVSASRLESRSGPAG